MINGLYVAASGMNVEQKRMDILSNNLSNINSTGYKSEKVVVKSFRDLNPKNQTNTNLNYISDLTIIDKSIIDLSDGSIRYTENPLDFAINGKNFFTIETPKGEKLSKNGEFKLNNEGYLVNSDGYFVKGINGNIHINDENNFWVDETGNIVEGEENTGKFKIVSVENPEDISYTGDSYFELKEGAAPVENPDINIGQGCIENSNVNGIAQMVEMISITRSFETNQKAITMHDEILNKTVNEIGKI